MVNNNEPGSETLSTTIRKEEPHEKASQEHTKNQNDVVNKQVTNDGIKRDMLPVWKAMRIWKGFVHTE